MSVKCTRKQWQTVRKMDHNTFVRFCENLYEDGQQSVLKNRKEINMEELKEVLLTVKGIGQKRTEEIIEKIEERIDGANVSKEPKEKQKEKA